MTPRRPLLLTGFEPFSRFPTNPSWEAATAAAAAFPDRVVARRLPVEHHSARLQLLAAIEELKPAAVLCMGLAPSDAFRLEQVAQKPSQFADQPGPPLLHGTWPWDDLEAVLRALDVPHWRSTDAGPYVCESTYWALLDAITDGRPCGFLHVPAVSGLFPLERTVEIVHAVIADYLATIETC